MRYNPRLCLECQAASKDTEFHCKDCDKKLLRKKMKEEE